MERYEERSNPVIRFAETHYEEVPGINTELKYFAKTFNDYAKKNHFRALNVIQIGKILRTEGYLTSQRKIKINGGNEVSSVVILNFSIKNHSNHSKPSKCSRDIHVRLIENCNGSNGSNGFKDKNKENIPISLDSNQMKQAGYSDLEISEIKMAGIIQ
jgi:hypothetical protein